jgi:UDP-3-O-[3-hydroxymyristoyl] N-acetylglucosamine deacetylase
MRRVRQRTLKNTIGCKGVGLHTNRSVALRLRPAAPDTGVLFRRIDLDRADATVAALHSNVVESLFCTTIGRDEELRIGTIEHLMAALGGLGIDNVIVEIDGPEVPIMDGSAAPFVFLIECAGTVEQDAPRRVVRVLKPISITDGERSVAISPADGLTISFELSYDNALIARQSFSFDGENGGFKTEIAQARTYCLEEEVEYLRSLGLAQGGSLENAIVVGDRGILNEGGLRHEDEFVRHKVLDCLGDLRLAGAHLFGHFHGVRSGHRLNHQLRETLFADESAWCSVTLPESRPNSQPCEPLAASA